jgi:hypothetical protein
MTQKGKENIAIISAGIFAFVGVMHLLRVIFNVDLIIGTTNIALWISVLPVFGTAFLVHYNLLSVENRSKAFWLKLILTFFILDALVVFYSWLAGLSYWGLSKTGFGFALVFDIIVILALWYYIRKLNKTA